MQRQNKNFTDRIKKDERQRVAAFVQLAYDNDPRIIAYKEKVRCRLASGSVALGSSQPLERSWAVERSEARGLRREG